MKTPSRKTKQRDAVQAALDRAEHPMNVGELLQAASKQAEGLGVATVYRAISALLAEGRIEAVEIPGEPVRYERSDKAHHHHFQCEKCERVFDIGGCIESLRNLVPPTFRVSRHAVTLFGTCEACTG